MTTGKKVLVWCAAAVGALAIASGAFVLYMRCDEPPPDDSDLRLPRVAIPEEQNAFPWFRLAGEKVYWPEDANDTSDDYQETGEPQTPADWLDAMQGGTDWNEALAAEIFERNQESLRLVDEGLARPALVLPVARDPLYEDLDWLFKWLTLSNAMILNARHLQHQGLEKEAFDEALRLVRFGNCIEKARGPIVSLLIALMVKGQGTDTLYDLAAQTHLKREALIAIVRDLKQYESDPKSLARILRFDYESMSRILEIIKTQQEEAPLFDSPKPGLITFLHFRGNETQRLYADMVRKAIEGIGKPYSEMGPIQGPEDPLHGSALRAFLTPNAFGKHLLSGLAPTFQGLQKQMCNAEAGFGMMRIILAMRAFKAKEGRLPEQLAEVVPKYLDAVPTDPFDGKPLRYNPEKKVIYTVGEDLEDSGGTTEAEWLGEKRLECEAKGREWTDEDERFAKEEMNRWDFPDPSWAIAF